MSRSQTQLFVFIYKFCVKGFKFEFHPYPLLALFNMITSFCTIPTHLDLKVKVTDFGFSLLKFCVVFRVASNGST